MRPRKMQIGGLNDPLRPKSLGVIPQDNTRLSPRYDPEQMKKLKEAKAKKERENAELLLKRAGLDPVAAKTQANPATRLKSSQKMIDEQQNKEYRTMMSQGYDPNKPIEEQYHLANIRGLDQRIYRGANMVMNENLGNPALNVARDVLFSPGKSFVNMSNPVENYVKPGFVQGATNLGMDLLNIAPTMTTELGAKAIEAVSKTVPKVSKQATKWLRGYKQNPSPTVSQEVISTSHGLDAVNVTNPESMATIEPKKNLQEMVEEARNVYHNNGIEPLSQRQKNLIGHHGVGEPSNYITTYQKAQNLKDLEYAKNHFQKYGYNIPDNLEDIAKSSVTTDETIQGLVNQHNTFARGVSTNWAELEKRNPEILRHLEGKGIDWKNNPKAAAEYMATHIPIKTGYGRASLDENIFDKGMDGLYTSNSIPTAEGYTYGDGFIVKAKRPTDFSSKNRENWINNNQVKYADEDELRALKYPITTEGEMAMKMGKNPEGAIKILEDRVKKYSDDAVNYKGDPNFWESGNTTQLENAKSDIEYIKKHGENLFKTIGDEKLIRTEHNANTDLSLIQRTNDFFGTRPVEESKKFTDFLKTHPYTKVDNEILDLGNKLNNLQWSDQQGIKKQILNLTPERTKLYNDAIKEHFSKNYPDFDMTDRYAHYIHLGTPGEKVLDVIESTRITPEIWKNKSRAHTNTYTKGLSAAAIAGITLNANLEEKKQGGMINYRGNKMQVGGQYLLDGSWQPGYYKNGVWEDTGPAIPASQMKKDSSSPTVPSVTPSVTPSVPMNNPFGETPWIASGQRNPLAPVTPSNVKPPYSPDKPDDGTGWHRTPEDIDPETGSTWDERLPDDHPDNPRTGESVGTYAERAAATSVTQTTTQSPHNWNTDIYLGLRGAQVATTYLGQKKRDNRMNEYDYKQQTALGLMNPMPISQFQWGEGNYTTPNRLYAEQGGTMNPYSHYAKYGGNLKTIIKDYKKWSNDAGPMDMTDGTQPRYPERKKGGFALDEMVVSDFMRKLMQFGRGPHPYRGYGNKRFQTGGRAPIVVTNPNDPRLKAYKDSLTLHNYGLQGEKYFKTNIEPLLRDAKQNPARKLELDEAAIRMWNGKNKSSFFSQTEPKVQPAWDRLTKLNKKTPTPEQKISSNSDSMFGYNKYKKPIQPVVYQKPQQAPVKQSQAYNDSLKLYIQGEKDFKQYQELNKTRNVPSTSIRKYEPIKYEGVNPAKIQPIEGHGYWYNHSPNVVSGTNIPAAATNNFTFRYKKPVGNIPVIKPQERKDYPIRGPLPKAQAKINITAPQQSMMPQQEGDPVYGPANSTIGYWNKGEFSPYRGENQQGKVNKPDVDLMQNPEELKKYLRGKGLDMKKKGGLTANKAREILHDGTAHGKKLTDRQRRYFGAMSKGHTNYRGK